MIGCNDPRYKCGTIVPSGCVPYTGKNLTFVLEDDQLACDANINDVFFKMDAQIKILSDANDFSEFNLGCFTLEDIDNVSLHQAQVLKICEIEADVAALTSQLNELNIGAEVISITLPECLVEDAAPCAVGENQYQLVNLLTLLVNKICDHESRISDLE